MTAVEAERATSTTKRAGPPAAVTEALGTLAATIEAESDPKLDRNVARRERQDQD